MSRSLSFRIMLLVFIFTMAAISVQGREAPKPMPASRTLIYGGPATLTKAATDTVVVMGPWGSGAQYNGQFQSPTGQAAWNDWTSNDLTAPSDNHWQADTYHAVNGTYSAWCGSINFPACDAGDEVGGYGNDWDDYLEWRGPVANPAAPCTVQISGVLNYDLEGGYDYLHVECALVDNQSVELVSFDGVGTAEVLNVSFVYDPADYDAGEVVVRFRVTSDGGWSDEDCSHPTVGAAQLDDIVITLSNGTGVSHDFEDGTLGPFTADTHSGVGDFAKIWTGLPASDPCNSNSSPQVAFIDDGLVVPGTGGTVCTSYCYGPGGYIVNNTGGLWGPDDFLKNSISSPVMTWPVGYDGGTLVFTAFEDANFPLPTSPEIFYYWQVRSTSDSNPTAIENAPWAGHGFLFLNDFFPGRYNLINERLDEYLDPGATFVQVRIVVLETNFQGGNGTDGTPAPYFDNVVVKATHIQGPEIAAWGTMSVFLDAFPANGTVDMSDPAALSVRLDARTQFASFADTTLLVVKAVRDGAVLSGTPELFYRLIPNPVFDAYRTSGLPNAGSVAGWGPTGNSTSLFAFDLPDSGFFFPGDRLRLYYKASDEVGGDIRTSILPADTTGFSVNTHLAYDDEFTVRALPSIREVVGSPGVYTQPDLLLWDETVILAEPEIWQGALAQLGLYGGSDYDLMTRRGTDGRLSNRLSLAQLDSYNDLILTYGSQEGIPAEVSPGVFLESWFGLGNKDLLVMGGGALRVMPGSFSSDRLGVFVVAAELATVIDGQEYPGVVPLVGNPVFGTADLNWRQNGACRGTDGPFRWAFEMNAIGVNPSTAAIPLAEFTDGSGGTGAYTNAAAILNVDGTDGGRAITMPVSLRQIVTAPGAAKTAAPLNARSRILGAILAYFGQAANPGAASDVPGVGKLTAAAAPNPFNPATVISYILPQAGKLVVNIFDVRGGKVRSLISEQRPAGPGQLLWSGKDDHGSLAPSGVYFYELRHGASVLVGKMTMIK